MPLLPPFEHITLIGINEAGSSPSLFGLGKGAVSQPSVNGSFSYPNARGNVSRFDSLVMELNHLRVSL